jgi:diguanylate cyclase (GGDEF)-like protein
MNLHANGSRGYADLLDIVIDATPSAILLTDKDGHLLHVKISKRPLLRTTKLRGKSFAWVLRMICSKSNAALIIEAYERCLETRIPLVLTKVEHLSTHNFREYFFWSFTPFPEIEGVCIFIRNVTENVLIEEEFDAVTEKYMEVNQDLRQAMSKLDFQFMDIDQAHKKLTALYHITSIVQKTVNEQEVLAAILDCIIQEWEFNKAAIFLLGDGEQELVVKAHRGLNNNLRIPLQRGIIGCAARQGELIYVPDVTADSRYIPTGNEIGTSEIAVPLIVNDKVIGVLDVEASKERIMKNYDLDLLRSLAGQIALTIAHANYVAKVEMEAITDPLTGLYNKRYFTTLIDKEIRRSVRYNRPLCMLMIDIDYYKNYNDACGHRMGDDVLRKVADIIRYTCRDVDFVVRYGGEEFCVLLPETEMQDAMDIAVRVRRAIEVYAFPFQEVQPNGTLTVSIGVAGCPYDALGESELIDHSDVALYTAKRLGRNRVCEYPDVCEK